MQKCSHFSLRPDSQTLLAYDWLAEQAEAAELKAAEKAREAAGLESESKKQRVRPGRLSRDSSRSSHTDMDSFDKYCSSFHTFSRHTDTQTCRYGDESLSVGAAVWW